MLTAQDRVLVGVSGGADSVALSTALRKLNFDIAVAHLNHGLRGVASDEDERFVASLAADMGAPFFVKRVSIGNGNVEAAGRSARKEFFAEVMRHGYTKVALGHNRDDRAETFLLNMMRGAGIEGLASMPPVAGSTVRPLIEFGREEIEEFLRSEGLAWRTDESNFDLALARNRMRHEVIPKLAALFNPQLPETLARTAALLQDENDWMTAMAREWIATNGLDAGALESVPVAFARRIIRMALPLTDLRFEHVETVRTLKSGKTAQLPGGWIAAREFSRIVVRQQPIADRDFCYELAIPGVVHVPELGKTFSAEIVGSELPSFTSPSRVFADGGRLGPCVKIRNWQPGDYYKPVGWPSGKVKKLFQRARVPRSQRKRWPVFDAGPTIVWIASFPVSREFVPCGSSQKIVAFEALPD